MAVTEITLVPARMDIRGFIRIQETVLKALKLNKFEYADVSVDKVGKRIAIQPTKKLKETSFRILQNPASVIVYLKGAMKEVGLEVVPGAYELAIEDGKFIFFGQKAQAKTGNWELFACRNSAGIPMISIDTRGTLILDKRTSTELNTIENNSFKADYNAKKKTFTLTFGKDGYSNVRTIASHANASFMGTLSSFGISLPKTRLRTSCTINENKLTFSVANLKTEEK